MENKFHFLFQCQENNNAYNHYRSGGVGPGLALIVMISWQITVSQTS